MSFLYPLFLVGAAAIVLPVISHLIHRRTRKRMNFSSLMFVPSTTVRFTRRNRLENIGLLLLRCLILLLLALAFARPFFPASSAEYTSSTAKRTVILLDRSASMNRRGLWVQALERANKVCGDADPTDRICLIAFDRTPEILVDFEQYASAEPARRSRFAGEVLAELSPGWDRTNLGQALIAAAEALDEDEIAEDRQFAAVQRQVVLISDFQQGSDLEALRTYDWPKATELIVEQVDSPGTTNAAVQPVFGGFDREDFSAGPLLGVRVTNTPDSAAERFRLRWSTDSETSDANGIDLYAAPGSTVFVPVPATADSNQIRRVVIEGDDYDFDNTLYLSPRSKQKVGILYVGADDSNDRTGMLYYTRRAFSPTHSLDPLLTRMDGYEPLNSDTVAQTHLIILAGSISNRNASGIREYLESGRTILLPLRHPDDVSLVEELTGLNTLEAVEADVSRYGMLARIDFEHEIFAPFSDPMFSDFTGIHFWKYRRVNLGRCPQARVLASFDNGDPALFELPAGKGSLVVMASGWSRSDSDLALSTKFVPLLYSIMEYRGIVSARQSQYAVGDVVPLSRLGIERGRAIRVRKPDGRHVEMSGESETFADTDLPGLYAFESDAGTTGFAVNVAESESRTAAMSLEDVESLGVSLSGSEPAVTEAVVERRLARSHGRVESEQKNWRAVLASVLAIVIIEILAAGWMTRPASAAEGERQ